MLANSSNKPGQHASSNEEVATNKKRVLDSRWWLAIAVPVWVIIGFGLANLVLVVLVQTLVFIGLPLSTIDKTLLNFIFAAFVYALSVVIVIGLPWWVRKKRTTRQDIGLTRLVSWMDIALAPAASIVYLLCSAALLALVKVYLPGVDLEQVQETGFSNLNSQYEMILAFVTLVVVAPFFEEVLFRGYLYGKIRKVVPVWIAIVIVSVAFAAVHGQWNVAFDVFALSIVLCVLREMTGSIWSGILLHMMKNGLAFYFLFVNPSLLGTMGG